MTPKMEEGDLLLKQSEDGMIARLKMFIHLRQDLERVRFTPARTLGTAAAALLPFRLGYPVLCGSHSLVTQ